MDNNPTSAEVIATEVGSRAWGLGDILAVSLLAAPFLVAAGNVAAAIIDEVGGQLSTTTVKAYTLALATEWAAPYYALLPIVSLAIAWWTVRVSARPAVDPRPEAVGDTANAGPVGDGEAVRLLRSKSVALAAVAILAIIACAAIGCAIGTFVVDDNISVPSAQLWASESDRLANAIATLAICGVGIAAGFAIRRSVLDRLSSAGTEETASAGTEETASAGTEETASE